MKQYKIIFIVFLLISQSDVNGQEQLNSELQDTSQIQTQSPTKRNTFKEIFSGKPGRAALYSFIVPGGGQIYNKKWLKLPLTYAIEGGAAYWLISNRRQFNKYDKIYYHFLDGKGGSIEGFTSAGQVRPVRAKYRKQTEYAWVFMLLAHLYNTFDAYVDRHLMDFDISEDISFKQLPPDINANYGSIGLVYQF